MNKFNKEQFNKEQLSIKSQTSLEDMLQLNFNNKFLKKIITKRNKKLLINNNKIISKSEEKIKITCFRQTRMQHIK